MKSEKSNKLPEGVGKRIIETLKSQDLDTEYSEIPETEIDDQDNSKEIEEDNQIYSEENDSQVESEIEDQSTQSSKEVSDIDYSYSAKAPLQNENKKYTEQNNNEISDIDTLLNLISQLPSGVTKQTGALIIRQTMEAMGISMNSVLSNAQSVQENLEYNVRNNINVIEEYRTKIKILEQEIQKFRKKSHELEDIISLFILSEEKN